MPAIVTSPSTRCGNVRGSPPQICRVTSSMISDRPIVTTSAENSAPGPSGRISASRAPTPMSAHTAMPASSASASGTPAPVRLEARYMHASAIVPTAKFTTSVDR